MAYFVISTDEDGDVLIHVYSKELLEAEFNLPVEEGGLDPKQVHPRIEDPDLQQRSGMYIIEGRLVSPRAVTEVTRWSLDGRE